MIEKIISGGQTGADRAALDTAIKLRIPHGGWIPKGRITENGPLPDRYHLMETPTCLYSERTEKNVADSDGTLILSHGLLTGGSEYTRKTALKLNKPMLHIDLNESDNFNAAARICLWLSDHGIKVLNVAGPRSSRDSKIYNDTVDILESLYYLSLIENDMQATLKTGKTRKDREHSADMPKTVDEAVEGIIQGLTLRDKAALASLSEEELVPLQLTLGLYIKERMRIWLLNESLQESLMQACSREDLNAANPAMTILVKIWRKLKATHSLRAVK